ncbi:MAG: GxxExxY protein [Phycisphaerales bacterium]|nr:MAG: GxxExxY protein [Phycisphaerales bacterium]
MHTKENVMAYGGQRDHRREGGRHGHHGGGHHGGRRGLPLSELDPALTEISRKVIGCAIEVHKAMGPGYDRDTYMTAMQHELKKQDVAYDTKAKFDVVYDGKKIGSVTPDLYLGERFLLMVIARPGEIGGWERSVLRAQLRSADLELGLIMNFAERRLTDGLVRVLNPDKLNLNRRDEEEDDEDLEDDDDEEYEDDED